MKRSVAVLAGLALALTAAPAAAQAPYVDQFTFISQEVPGISPYRGSLANTPLDGNKIWCVDLLGEAVWSGDAWVTSMDQNDFSKTELGNPATNAYRWAAFFASEMVWTGAAGTDPSDDDKRLQYAIWALLGYDISAGQLNGANIALQSYFGAGATFDDLRATGPTIEEFDYRRWVVITRVDCAPGIRCNPADAQEYIGLRPGIPTEVVPEPATMTLLATGLAGMAAARRRRKTA